MFKDQVLGLTTTVFSVGEVSGRPPGATILDKTGRVYNKGEAMNRTDIKGQS